MNSLSPTRLLTVLLVTSVTLSTTLAAASSLRWPLVGDTTLMHYAVFLLNHGFAPYKSIVDINLPGAYFFESLPMHLFGPGALAWRVYDLSLYLIATLALRIITKPASWLLGIATAAFFLLIHLQDGIPQAGQRDLLIAVLLLCAYAALFTAQRSVAASLSFFLFGLFLGCTFTIKPTLIPLFLALLLLAMRPADTSIPRTRRLGLAILGVLTPCAIALGWLAEKGAVGAFVHNTLPLIRLHAELDRRTLAYLLSHVTAPVAVVCVLWVVVLILHRPKFTLERSQLLIGLALTLLAYVAQAKGYPYQRYPFLALLLPIMAIDLASALNSAKLASRIPAIAAFASLALAPRMAWQVLHYTPVTPFRDALEARLRPIGPALSGNIQCLDTFGGCIDTLYDMRLVQSTSFLYDCYLFTTHTSEETERYRSAFLADFDRTQPKIVVLTDQFCFNEPGGFTRLSNWPQLDRELATAYTASPDWHADSTIRWWSRSETPTAFRIYTRK